MPTRNRKRKSRAKPRPNGRPSLYKPKFCEIAAAQYKAGATDIEVADTLGVNASTLYRWQHEHPNFREASKVAKQAADDRVERSMYARAVGYSFDSVKIMQHNGQPVVVPFREHVPPDPGSCFKWLSNRKPDEWRERVEHTGPGGGPIQHSAVVNVHRSSPPGHSST